MATSLSPRRWLGRSAARLMLSRNVVAHAPSLPHLRRDGLPGADVAGVADGSSWVVEHSPSCGVTSIPQLVCRQRPTGGVGIERA